MFANTRRVCYFGTWDGTNRNRTRTRVNGNCFSGFSRARRLHDERRTRPVKREQLTRARARDDGRKTLRDKYTKC